MSIIEKIVSSNYIVTIDMVEELTRQHLLATKKRENLGSTYFSTLIATTQREIDGKEEATGLDELKTIHKAFYGGVIRAIAATGIKGADAQKRAGFARSAASTIKTFIESGGDIRKVEAGKISKEQMRAMVAEFKKKESAPNDTEPGEFVKSAIQSVVDRIRLVAKSDLIEARRELQDAIEQLAKELDEITEMEDDENEETEPYMIMRHDLQRTDRGKPDHHPGH